MSDCKIRRLRAAEFFAGIGLARMGLSPAFDVVWANDYESAKAEMYEGHFRDKQAQLSKPGHEHVFVTESITAVCGEDLPNVDLAWASFPCTDLSLAGNRLGLEGTESGTFFEFVRILDEMAERKPSVIALENVIGLATSHGGKDLAIATAELNTVGYSVDLLTLDARRFVPQSRPRLFAIGAIEPPADVAEPNSDLRPDWLQWPFGDSELRTHQAALPTPPPPLTSGLSQYVERIPYNDARWWDVERTANFLRSLSTVQQKRMASLRSSCTMSYRTAYRRTRNGVAVWEVRPDDIAGCLRTARGGSSKQALVLAGRGEVRARWMTPREYGQLMGAGEYTLTNIRVNQGLFGFGDGVCVPVVSWLTKNYLAPLVQGHFHARPVLSTSA